MILFFYCLFKSKETDSFLAINQRLEKEKKFDLPVYSDEEQYLQDDKGKAAKADDYIPPSDSDYNLEKDDLFERIDTKDMIDSSLEEKLSKTEELDLMAKKLNRLIEDDSLIKPVTDKEIWTRLYEFLKENLDEFMIDGHLGVEMHIKYIFCVYVVAFIPAEFVFAFPAFLPKLLPKKAFKIPVVRDILEEMTNFLKFIRFRSKKTLIIPFFIGKKNSVLEDLELIKKIPELIYDDPEKLFKSLFALKVNAKGYDDFKKQIKPKK